MSHLRAKVFFASELSKKNYLYILTAVSAFVMGVLMMILYLSYGKIPCTNGLYQIGRVCQSCRDHFDFYCTQCNEEGCYECEVGYFLTNDGECLNCQDYHGVECYDCHDIFTCTACSESFSLLNGHCTDCPFDANCKTCTNDLCNECMWGYGLVDGRCIICSELFEGCETCTEDECTYCL